MILFWIGFLIEIYLNRILLFTNTYFSCEYIKMFIDLWNYTLDNGELNLLIVSVHYLIGY